VICVTELLLPANTQYYTLTAATVFHLLNYCFLRVSISQFICVGVSYFVFVYFLFVDVWLPVTVQLTAWEDLSPK